MHLRFDFVRISERDGNDHDVTVQEALDYKQELSAVDGVTAVTWLDDAVGSGTLSSMLSKFSDKMGDKFNIKAAFVEGKVLSETEIAEMSALENKSALYAKVLGTMLLRSVAHDLRSPLTALYGTGSLLADDYALLDDAKRRSLAANMMPKNSV